MNFWTSVLVVFLADAVLGFMKYSTSEGFFIITATTVIYFIVQYVIVVASRWNNVG